MSMNQTKTDDLFDKIANTSKDIFQKKLKDYGPSWRVLRDEAVLEQLWIKAKRIRTIQEADGKQLVNGIGDDIPSEFKGIFNYSIIGLIQMKLQSTLELENDIGPLVVEYEYFISECKKLMQKKNHDYGEAWRDMSQIGFIDFIITKILRLKQIIYNDGKVQISENPDAVYMDIVNYCVFALILMEEVKEVKEK